jgi:hypothetical protein
MAKIFDLPDNQEDRSFEEQMADLGVPIEKVNIKTAKVLTDWIKPGNAGGQHNYDMSVRRSHISIKPKWAEKIAGKKTKTKLIFRIVKYEDKLALLFKENSSGFSIKKPAIENRAWHITLSPAFKRELEQYGFEFGCYKIGIVKDGYLAVQE